MKIVPLTQEKVALVDDEDYKLVSRFKWHADEMKNRKNLWYARTGLPRAGGRSRGLRMHTLIMGKGVLVDHRDGNGLNNQRTNLRIATRSQNLQNCAPWKHSSRFKGVCRSRSEKLKKPWRVEIQHERKKLFLGRFRTQKLAATAYNEAAKKLFGPFARLNPV